MWVWVNLFLSGKQENTLLSNDPIFLVRSLPEGQDGHVRQRLERCWGSDRRCWLYSEEHNLRPVAEGITKGPGVPGGR